MAGLRGRGHIASKGGRIKALKVLTHISKFGFRFSCFVFRERRVPLKRSLRIRSHFDKLNVTAQDKQLTHGSNLFKMRRQTELVEVKSINNIEKTKNEKRKTISTRKIHSGLNSRVEDPKEPITKPRLSASSSECHIEPVEMQTSYTRRLKAFTLLESVTAITIITILIGVSTMIYSNVVESEKPMAYYQAKQDLSKIYQNTKTNQAFFTKSFSFENYDIQQEVDFYKGNKKLYQINYTITSKGEVWWSENHLVANKYNAL